MLVCNDRECCENGSALDKGSESSTKTDMIRLTGTVFQSSINGLDLYRHTDFHYNCDLRFLHLQSFVACPGADELVRHSGPDFTFRRQCQNIILP